MFKNVYQGFMSLVVNEDAQPGKFNLHLNKAKKCGSSE